MNKSTGKRIGDDLYIYKGNHVTIIENFYDKKDKKNKEKHKIFGSRRKRLLWAILLLGIIFTAYIINTPFPKFVKNKIQFSFEADKNTFRAGYPIVFRWEISNFPSQAIITWGDGTTLDINEKMNQKNGVFHGKINHTYSLQGRYNPRLTIWDFFGQQYLKSIELTIQNNIIQFNISCQDQIFEDQAVFIDVENIFDSNNKLSKDIENLTYIYNYGDSQVTSNKPNISHKWKNEGNYTLTVSIIDSQGTISRRSKSIQVKNKPPEAVFTILSKRYHWEHSVIKFSAENSVDTESDENSLRYLWNWGDSMASWGKFSTHSRE